MAVAAGESAERDRAEPERGRARVTALGPVLVLVGSALVVVASFLTWLVSGSVRRSSYSVVRAAELLGVVHGFAAVVLKVWYLVPILGAMVLLATLSGARRLELGAGAALVVLAVAVSAVVIASPLRTGSGPWLALAGSAVVVIGSILTLLDLRGHR